MLISKDDLINFIEPHFIKDLTLDEYTVTTVQAKNLITSTRLDIIFKILYLEMKTKHNRFAYNIYKDHIRAFTLGKFHEPGNQNKINIQIFLEDFDKTFENIKEHGFDPHKTLIPLSKNGSIANGAHRTASAIFLNKEVSCVNLGTYNHIYDYQFFYSRNVPAYMLDIAATKFIEYTNNSYIAFLWPTGAKHEPLIEKLIPNIFYIKKIKLTHLGAHNLISQIYFGEEWLGTINNNFSGAHEKLIHCFKTFDEFSVVGFQASNLNEVIQIKEHIRDSIKMGKHSIHITDTKEEAVRISRAVFNNNSIHMLNHARPNQYYSTHEKIEQFKKFIAINNCNNEDFLLDSSIVLSLYGLREAKDIDYLCSKDLTLLNKIQDINSHEDTLQFHGEDLNELLYNPQNYFYFNGVKFISFSQLYKMKCNRGEKKDINDCKMMEALIANDRGKQLISKLKQNIYYKKIKARAMIIDLLQRLKLYDYVKIVYKKLLS